MRGQQRYVVAIKNSTASIFDSCWSNQEGYYFIGASDDIKEARATAVNINRESDWQDTHRDPKTGRHVTY